LDNGSYCYGNDQDGQVDKDAGKDTPALAIDVEDGQAEDKSKDQLK